MQALAIELKPYGIQCCSILPGDTKTGFTAARKYTVKSQSPDSVYSQKMKTSVGKMEKEEQNGMSAESVAAGMVQQVLNKKMKVFVVPGLQYQLICSIYSLLPARVRLWVVGLLYGWKFLLKKRSYTKSEDNVFALFFIWDERLNNLVDDSILNYFFPISWFISIFLSQ